MNNIIIGLSKKNDENREYVGSGFFITDEWVVTAKHVLLHFFGLKWSEQENGAKKNCSIIGVSFNGKIPHLWEAYEALAMKNSDIALLKVKPKLEKTKYVLDLKRINLEMPKLGSKIIGKGYPKAKIIDKGELIEWNIKLVESEGVVEEIHEHQRDSANLNFPCYRVKANFDSGMSGGPVFNSNDEIVGVVCYGMDAELSYAASIWPIYQDIIKYQIPIDVLNKEYVTIVCDRKTNQINGIAYTG